MKTHGEIDEKPLNYAKKIYVNMKKNIVYVPKYWQKKHNAWLFLFFEIFSSISMWVFNISKDGFQRHKILINRDRMLCRFRYIDRIVRVQCWKYKAYDGLSEQNMGQIGSRSKCATFY